MTVYTHAEIIALLDQVTPGEYTVIMRGVEQFGYDVNPIPSGERGMFERLDDAAFVAAAPDIIKQLLDESQQLLKKLDSITTTTSRKYEDYKPPGGYWKKTTTV